MIRFTSLRGMPASLPNRKTRAVANRPKATGPVASAPVAEGPAAEGSALFAEQESSVAGGDTEESVPVEPSRSILRDMGSPPARAAQEKGKK